MHSTKKYMVHLYYHLTGMHLIIYNSTIKMNPPDETCHQLLNDCPFFWGQCDKCVYLECFSFTFVMFVIHLIERNYWNLIILPIWMSPVSEVIDKAPVLDIDSVMISPTIIGITDSKTFYLRLKSQSWRSIDADLAF